MNCQISSEDTRINSWEELAQELYHQPWNLNIADSGHTWRSTNSTISCSKFS